MMNLTSNYRCQKFTAMLILAAFVLLLYKVLIDEKLTKRLQEIVRTGYQNLDLYLIKENKKAAKEDLVNCENPPKLKDLEEFFNHGVKKGKTICDNLAEMGGNHKGLRHLYYPYNEGAMMICLDVMTRGDCVVLSFGIGNDSPFDGDIEDVGVCKLYMFDPVIGVKDFKNPPNREFYNLGLSGHKGMQKIEGIDCKVDRYEGILQMLNLTNVPIDFLKIDIDGSELDFFKDVFSTSPHLLKNVKQIGMEIHPIILKRSKDSMSFVEAFQPYLEAMHRLECLGYELISFVPSLIPSCRFIHKAKKVSGCYDIVYMKRNVN